MRIITWNLNGAPRPGRATKEQQRRAWHHVAALNPDLALIQEAQGAAIPPWAFAEWTIVRRDEEWGSCIVARTELELSDRPDLRADPLLDLLYGYLLVGEIKLPDGRRPLAASVHAPARTAADFFKSCIPNNGRVAPEDVEAMAQPGTKTWALDFCFWAIERVVRGESFFAGGDWNESRLFDGKRADGTLWSSMFFSRAAGRGWFDCHASKPEERSYFGRDGFQGQLDHLFCDKATGARLRTCRVCVDDVVREVSDHAPLVTDFELG